MVYELGLRRWAMRWKHTAGNGRFGHHSMEQNGVKATMGPWRTQRQKVAYFHDIHSRMVGWRCQDPVFDNRSGEGGAVCILAAQLERS